MQGQKNNQSENARTNKGATTMEHFYGELVDAVPSTDGPVTSNLLDWQIVEALVSPSCDASSLLVHMHDNRYISRHCCNPWNGKRHKVYKCPERDLRSPARADQDVLGRLPQQLLVMAVVEALAPAWPCIAMVPATAVAAEAR